MKSRDPERIDRILAALREVWKRYPDMRLGQLVHSGACAGGWTERDAFHVEDEQVERGLRSLAKKE